MQQIQRQVKEFMLAAGQDCPEKPIVPDVKTRELRVRLLLEEVLEFAQASGVDLQVEHGNSCMDIDNYSFTISGEPDLVEVADAICDINYVSYGAALSYGLDLDPFEQEVHTNNLSKIATGYKDENGKLRKGPDYRPVDLMPILNKQLYE